MLRAKLIWVGANRCTARGKQEPGKNYSDWDYYVTNPSALLLDDGSVMLVFSSVPGDRFKESLGTAFASHWNATYVQDPSPIWEPADGSTAKDANGVGNIEDPFVWRDARGHFPIIAHSQGSKNLCEGGKDAGSACSVHLSSETAHGPWTTSLEAVFTNHTVLTNGSLATFFTRQRPQIVFAPDGVTPRVMVVGGSFDEYNNGVTSLERTFIFEFDTAKHASHESPWY